VIGWMEYKGDSGVVDCSGSASTSMCGSELSSNEALKYC
jgi:hypothetical protein